MSAQGGKTKEWDVAEDYSCWSGCLSVKIMEGQTGASVLLQSLESERLVDLHLTRRCRASFPCVSAHRRVRYESEGPR